MRFGRVPKREKAKILEQMQRVNVQCQGSLVENIVADEVSFTFTLVIMTVINIVVKPGFHYPS